MVGEGALDMKGASEAEVAPGKATEVVVRLGAREVAFGLRTLLNC